MSATAMVPGFRPVTITPAAGDGTGGQAGGQPGEGPRPRAQQSPGQRGLRALVGLVVSFVVPLLSYDLIRPHVGSSAMALALAGAIPVVYTLAILVVTRRLSPIGVVGAVTFGISVLVSWATGGSTLAIELQDPGLFGLLGIAFLVSVAIGRPLHPVILRLLGRGDPRYNSIASRAERKTSMVITTILGLTLLAHAAAIAVLALTQSTSTFVALQHPVGLPIFGLGLACLFFYRSRLQARQSAAATLAVRDDEPADGERGDGERGDDEAAGTS